ncbi:MAG: hypothetical protein Q9181_004116, partial [Wetmoreana brouardii]
PRNEIHFTSCSQASLKLPQEAHISSEVHYQAECGPTALFNLTEDEMRDNILDKMLDKTEDPLRAILTFLCLTALLGTAMVLFTYLGEEQGEEQDDVEEEEEDPVEKELTMEEAVNYLKLIYPLANEGKKVWEQEYDGCSSDEGSDEESKGGDPELDGWQRIESDPEEGGTG